MGKQNHLARNYSKYGISSNFKYLIVSKSPEIVSHFSQYLILSINEFEYWLKTRDLNTTFEDVLKDYWKIYDSPFTSKQLSQMQRDLETGWRFTNE
ncbi:hypothetical protein ES705_35272 [subsurface metagenome]